MILLAMKRETKCCKLSFDLKLAEEGKSYARAPTTAQDNFLHSKYQGCMQCAYTIYYAHLRSPAYIQPWWRRRCSRVAGHSMILWTKCHSSKKFSTHIAHTTITTTVLMRKCWWPWIDQSVLVYIIQVHICCAQHFHTMNAIQGSEVCPLLDRKSLFISFRSKRRHACAT